NISSQLFFQRSNCSFVSPSKFNAFTFDNSSATFRFVISNFHSSYKSILSYILFLINKPIVITIIIIKTITITISMMYLLSFLLMDYMYKQTSRYRFYDVDDIIFILFVLFLSFHFQFTIT